MKIDAGDYYLSIDFEVMNAGWGLLVVDDKWHTVKRLIVGLTDPVTHCKKGGLGDRCLDYENTFEYWNILNPPEEIFELSLSLLPWMVHGTKGIRGITFCDFPETKERLDTVLQSYPEDYAPLGWIFLIDITDNSGSDKRERFCETWKILDELGYPNYVRSRFTRGGRTIPSWVHNIPSISKEPPQGGYPKHKQIVQDWLLRLQGQISDTLFQKLTNVSDRNPKGLYHNPSDIINASAKDTTAEYRQRICTELSSQQYDLYGVWRWCSQEAYLSPPPSTAAHRWLACKAFQTSDINSRSVPVTAVIAICEGACYLIEDLAWSYNVKSPLLSVTEDNINKLMNLGCILLPEENNYGAFAEALRNWLVIPEQFEPDKASIVNISITNDSDDRKSIISMEYSNQLPENIFSSLYTGRKGRVRRAWDELSAFAATAFHNSNIVSLEFNWME